MVGDRSRNDFREPDALNCILVLSEILGDHTAGWKYLSGVRIKMLPLAPSPRRILVILSPSLAGLFVQFITVGATPCLVMPRPALSQIYFNRLGYGSDAEDL